MLLQCCAEARRDLLFDSSWSAVIRQSRAWKIRGAAPLWRSCATAFCSGEVLCPGARYVSTSTCAQVSVVAAYRFEV